MESYIQEDTDRYISGHHTGRSLHSYSLTELLNIIDLTAFESELKASFKMNYKKGPVLSLGNKFDVSKANIQTYIDHVFGRPYQELRREFIKDTLDPYLKQGFEASDIAPHFDLSPGRAANTLNRWSQETFGATFKDAKRVFVKEKIKYLIINGHNLEFIARQFEGLTRRGIQSIILEEWRGIYNARRTFAEPILEHLCRIDATHGEVQEILGIVNVNAFTQKLWGMSFSEAKNFFRDLYLGYYAYDSDLPPF